MLNIDNVHTNAKASEGSPVVIVISMFTTYHPELSGCITTLRVRNVEVANFCAAMDTLIDQDDHLQAVTGFESHWSNLPAVLKIHLTIFISYRNIGKHGPVTMEMTVEFYLLADFPLTLQSRTTEKIIRVKR